MSSIAIIEPESYCSNCHKIWTLETRQGVCPWCGKPSNLTTRPTHALRTFKSSGRRKRKQAPIKSNGYDYLDGQWAIYYRVALRFSHKARIEDTEDLLHTIIANLADAERNNGHQPFTQAVMYRIASRAQADYWRTYYKLNNGLDCHSCSKAQRQTCREEDLYRECPKAIKLESLNKPVLDDDGNLTELGNLIADDKALDLDAWVSGSTWELGYPRRLVDIAYRLKAGLPLTHYERNYLWRYRQREQKTLI